MDIHHFENNICHHYIYDRDQNHILVLEQNTFNKYNKILSKIKTNKFCSFIKYFTCRELEQEPGQVPVIQLAHVHALELT